MVCVTHELGLPDLVVRRDWRARPASATIPAVMRDAPTRRPFALLFFAALAGACGSSAAPEGVEPQVDTAAITRELRARTSRIDCRGEVTCALIGDGSLRCWGAGAGPLRSSDVHGRTLVVGDDHACVLDDAGAVRCVGTPEATRVPAGSLLALDTHGALTCGIRDDLGATCWGSTWSYLNAPPEGPFRGFDFASDRACAVGLDGALSCWSPPGALSPIDARPTRTTTPAGDESVDCGHGVCTRRANGSIACTGARYAGQTRAPEGRFVAIASGRAHSCAVREDGGGIACWGANDAGQSTPPDGRFRAVVAGGDSTCAVDLRGAAVCWGAPIAGMPALTQPRALAVAPGLACAVTAERAVQCFGDDATNVADLLAGAPAAHDVFVRSEAIDIQEVGGGWRCLRREHLGDPATGVTGTSWAAPPAITCTPFAPVAPDASVRAVGPRNACTIDAEGSVLCTGDDGFGQLAAPPGRYRAIAAGDDHSCALTVEGRAVCWGSYADGAPL